MLISVATLIATLPTAARAQAEPPGALDLATLPGDTQKLDWYINLAYLNGTWVYKVETSYTQAPTTGTPFNGTITGTMPEVGRQFVIHPSADPDSDNPPTLTLKDAVITSNSNQLFYIPAGAELTLRIEGENRIEITSGLIYNLGTLTLTVADALEISQGIANGSPMGGITSTLTVDAQAPLSIGSIRNNESARMHLDGEIHVINKTQGASALINDNTSPDAITFGDNARIRLQANGLCTNVRSYPFIELYFDTALADARTLSVTPAGDTQPAATFATDGTCVSYAFLATADTRYTASLDGERLYAGRFSLGSTYEDGDYLFFQTDGTYRRYSGATTTRPTPQPLNLSKDYGSGSTRTGIDLFFDPANGWYCDGKMFDGTVTTNGSSSYINIPATIHAEGEATLTLDKVNFQLPTGTALTVASGTVRLQNNAHSPRLSGTHALRVETGATCLIPTPADPDNTLALTAAEQAIHPEGGGTVKGLVQLTWPESPSGYIYLKPAEPAENPNGLTFNLTGMKSIATNYPLSFYLENQSTGLKQEGYRSDDPGQTYLSTFPAAHPDGLTSYTGLREVPPVWIVIDKETAFDASMPGQWLRVTEKGVLTVGKIGENGVFPLVNDLELQDGGQIRFADDGVLGLVAARFTHLFPNRNQWRATTLASDAADKLAGGAGTPCYVRTGYPDATDQTWQPADPDNLYMQFAAGDPVLIAGEGPETDTLRLNYGNTYLFKDSPDSPVEPTSPAEPLNTGVFLFKGNRAPYNVEMRNIYVLSDDGSRFELKDRVTLRPFESYVVANAATQALLKSLRLDGIVTGTELAEIPADNSFRAWTADGRLHLSADHAEKVAVYHVSGTLKCYLPLLRGETTIALPSGIYLVRQGGTTIKVVL